MVPAASRRIRCRNAASKDQIPNSVLKKIRIELRKHIKPRDIAKMSESEYAIYLAEAREQIRRKYSKKRVDPSDKPGKSGGYQTKAGGRL